MGELGATTKPNYFFLAVSHWALPGGSGAWQNYTFEQIKNQDYEPTSRGTSFGPTWATHWFKVQTSSVQIT